MLLYLAVWQTCECLAIMFDKRQHCEMNDAFISLSWVAWSTAQTCSCLCEGCVWHMIHNWKCIGIMISWRLLYNRTPACSWCIASYYSPSNQVLIVSIIIMSLQHMNTWCVTFSGVNITSFALPSALYPREVRATYNGVASGKKYTFK